jgi:two-component system sensor histidine kinase DesK
VGPSLLYRYGRRYRIRGAPRFPALETVSALYRTAALAALCLAWVFTDDGLAGLFLVPPLAVLTLVRERFPRVRWTLLLDQALIAAAALFWNEAAFAFALVAFEAVRLGGPAYALPAAAYGAAYIRDPVFWLAFAQGAFAGFGLRGWGLQRAGARSALDAERGRQRELELLKDDLIAANLETARMAELYERVRIARDIHDHAGHDIVAAYISLQAVRELLETDPVQGKELFDESMARFERGIGRLREAVHNLTPVAELGLDRLRSLCTGFSRCPVRFEVYGDASTVRAHLWSVLVPCLKEALTNILRHADASEVTVTLDITPHIVRLCVENDGVKRASRTRGTDGTESTGRLDGVGLRNLRERAAAVGGTLAADCSDRFRLVCVLPVGAERVI